MKRLMVALLVGGAFFAVAFGFAENLGSLGGAIQVGEDDSLGCADHAVVLGWAYEGDTGLVDKVRVSLHDAAHNPGACDGESGYDLFVHVFDDDAGGNANLLESCTQNLAGVEPGNGWSCDFSPDVPGEDIELIRIAVEGSDE